jgi:hypothetical protein
VSRAVSSRRAAGDATFSFAAISSLCWQSRRQRCDAETVEKGKRVELRPVFPRSLPCQTDVPLLGKLNLTDYWGLEDNALIVSRLGPWAYLVGPCRVGLIWAANEQISSKLTVTISQNCAKRERCNVLPHGFRPRPASAPRPDDQIVQRGSRESYNRSTIGGERVLRCRIAAPGNQRAIKFLLFTPYQRSNPLPTRWAGGAPVG